MTRSLRRAVLSFEFAEADELFLLLIPESEKGGLQTGKERDRIDILKFGIFVVTFLKMIVRNQRFQVMNVMIADVAGEPLQDFRQAVKGTALHGRQQVAPFVIGFPIGVLELVLNVKYPDARASGKPHHGRRNLQ